MGSKEKELPGASETHVSEVAEEETLAVGEKTRPVLEPELLERIEHTARTVAITAVRHEMHVGPMPAPKQYGEYERVLPGTAKVILDEFEANSRHVRTMEDKALSGRIANDADNRKTAERLVWGAFILILVLALTSHEKSAMVVSATTVAAVITGFLSGKRLRRPEPKEPAADEGDE